MVIAGRTRNKGRGKYVVVSSITLKIVGSSSHFFLRSKKLNLK